MMRRRECAILENRNSCGSIFEAQSCAIQWQVFERTFNGILGEFPPAFIAGAAAAVAITFILTACKGFFMILRALSPFIWGGSCPS